MSESQVNLDEPQPKFAAVALIVGAAAISFAAIFFRLAAPTHPLAAAAIRLGIASLLLSPFVIRAIRLRVHRARVWRAAVAGGAFYAVHFGAWIWSLEFITVAASVTLVTATPLLLAVWGLARGVDKPGPRLWGALVLSVIGVATIGGADLGDSSDALLGNVLAVVGAAAMAGYMLVVRPLGKVDVFAFTGVATATGAMILAMTAWLTGAPLAPASPVALGYLALAALIPQLIGHSLLTWSLRHVTPTTVGIATLGEPVGAAILAAMILNEIPTLQTIVGCVITLAAVGLALRASRALKPVD